MSRLRLFRVAERFMLVLLIVGITGLAYLFVNGMIVERDLIIGGAILAVTVLVLFFIQTKLDQWTWMAVTQSNFANNEAFDDLFDKSPVPYITIDALGTIVDFNPAAIQLLKSDSESMRGVNFYKLLVPHENFDPSVLKSKISNGLTIKDEEASMQTLEKGRVWVSMSVYVSHNKHERLIALVDMTEKKMVDTAKSEFVALATHQLRTPIAAIRWNMELLKKKLGPEVPEQQDKYVVKIERNVTRMINLIDDFLSVSKLEMGTFASTEAYVNLTDFMDGILEEFTEKITQKQLKVDRHDNPPQVMIETDERLFHIIVSNLVSNSVKYLRSGGTLMLAYTMRGEQLEIIVADNGIGVPEEEVDKLFTKFFRASNAQLHQTEGTGLGLYVVKQSVEQLGGTITVHAKEDEGVRFTINLPATVVSAQHSS